MDKFISGLKMVGPTFILLGALFAIGEPWHTQQIDKLFVSDAEFERTITPLRANQKKLLAHHVYDGQIFDALKTISEQLHYLQLTEVNKAIYDEKEVKNNGAPWTRAQELHLQSLERKRDQILNSKPVDLNTPQPRIDKVVPFK